MILFYIVAVGALVGTFIALMRDTLARSVLFVAWISIIVFLCIFSTDIYGYYDLIFQKIKEIIEDFDKYRSAAIFYCTLAALVGTIIGFILGSGRNWPWSRRLWGHIKKNPPIILLVIAWIFIALAIWFFGFDILKLYRILAEQILKGEEDADGYRAIAIRYFGIVAGAGAVIGYIFATGRNIILDNQNKINTQAQTTESMVQAITQVGAFNGNKPNIEVRLGGLYSLQRIMQDSPRDELAIAKIFYAYVRENTKRDENKQKKQYKKDKVNLIQPREDVQAALDIINQFNKEWEEDGKKISPRKKLNIAYGNLAGYSFEEMDLSDAILENADLSDATLVSTNLSFATLSGANLTNAILCYTKMSNADLTNTNLSEAIILSADLSGVDLSGANLSGAVLVDVNLIDVDLSGADLSGTKLFDLDLSTDESLTQEQINLAEANAKTKPPKGLIRPEHWDKEKDTDELKTKNSKKTP